MGLGGLVRASNDGWDRARGMEDKADALRRDADSLRGGSYWLRSVVQPMADAVAPLIGADRTQISGPFGLGARVHVGFLCRDESVGYLVLEPTGIHDGRRPSYDTWARTDRYAPGIIGEMNGGTPSRRSSPTLSKPSPV